MKTLLFSLTSLLLISFVSLKAQTASIPNSLTDYSNDNCELITITKNQSFDSVKIFPKTPTENDLVKVVVYISNETKYREYTPLISPTLIFSDTLRLFIHSLERSPRTTTKINDTILIGKLSPKVYNVVLLNKRIASWGGPEPDEIRYVDTVQFTIPIKAFSDLNIVRNNFIIYPNPTSEKIYIENKFNKEEIEKISIYDMLGKTKMNFEDHSVLNIKNLANGIYILQINLKNGAIYKQKIIKK